MRGQSPIVSALSRPILQTQSHPGSSETALELTTNIAASNVQPLTAPVGSQPGADKMNDRTFDTQAAPNHSSGMVLRRPFSERPLIKLTTHLLDTYQRINANYYEKKKEADDKKQQRKKKRRKRELSEAEAEYKFVRGQVLNGRYCVESVLGKGSFGQVIKAYDEKTTDWVAIKIVKAKRIFYRQAQVELRILNLLQKEGGLDHHIVQVRDAFLHQSHQCIVFELLSISLYQLLKTRRFRGSGFVCVCFRSI
jgi:hypothetical protein